MAIRMSAREFQKLTNAFEKDSTCKKSKFHNEKVREGALIFDSKGEYDRYKYLQILEKTGEISDLTFHQEQIILLDDPVIKYIPDFCYIENGIKIIEDFKGVQTKEFIIKKKLIASMIKKGANYGFKIVRKTKNGSYESYEEYMPSSVKESDECKHDWIYPLEGTRQVKWCKKCGAIHNKGNVMIPSNKL